MLVAKIKNIYYCIEKLNDCSKSIEFIRLLYNLSKILAHLAHFAIMRSNKCSLKSQNISRTTKSTKLTVATNQNKTGKPIEKKLPEFVKKY